MLQDAKKTLNCVLQTEKLEVEKVNVNHHVANSSTLNRSLKFQYPIPSIETSNETDANDIPSVQMRIG